MLTFNTEEIGGINTLNTNTESSRERDFVERIQLKVKESKYDHY